MNDMTRVKNTTFISSYENLASDDYCDRMIEAWEKIYADSSLREHGSDGSVANNGAKHSLFNLFSATIQEGDEVIIPAPYWVTYPELVKYCGGTVVEIQTQDTSAFKITPEQLKSALTKKTKMLILTSPSNPTGSVYSKEELTALGKVLEGTDVIVASDEMYEKLIYDGTFMK